MYQALTNLPYTGLTTMFKNRFLYVFLHIVMWIGYTALPLLNAFQNDSTRSRVNPYTNTTYWLYVSVTSIILFYINSEVLFPKIYKKQPIRYFLSLISVILILLWGRYFVRITFVGSDINKSLFYVNAFIQYLYVFGISASYCFFSE